MDCVRNRSEQRRSQPGRDETSRMADNKRYERIAAYGIIVTSVDASMTYGRQSTGAANTLSLVASRDLDH